MLRFWIITIIKRNGATLVVENKVYTDKAEAHKAWDEMDQNEGEEVELVECTSAKTLERK
jgi:hypothetical protein